VIRNLLIIALGCATASTFGGCCSLRETRPERNASANERTLERTISDQSTLAVLWYQHAAEVRALYLQACNLGRRRIDESLAKDGRTNVVIVDIDETILDNSPYQGALIQRGEIYREATWSNWVNFARADALAGVSNLLTYAAARNVEVVYISNRKENQTKATIANLARMHLPFADERHVLLRQGGDSKDDRREPFITNANYNVVFLMGDNLADFAGKFETLDQVSRRRHTDEAAEDFGTKYIIVPNPMYGDWENTLYQKKSSNAEKLQGRKNLRWFRFDTQTVEQRLP
jgi:5'-nucleotidase (lipoprotein e(P4) family)